MAGKERASSSTFLERIERALMTTSRLCGICGGCRRKMFMPACRTSLIKSPSRTSLIKAQNIDVYWFCRRFDDGRRSSAGIDPRFSQTTNHIFEVDFAGGLAGCAFPTSSFVAPPKSESPKGSAGMCRRHRASLRIAAALSIESWCRI